METSPNWNVEIVPGAKRVKRMVAAVVEFAQVFPPDSYPSDHRRIEEPPHPGEIGGVIAQPTLFDEANAIIN